MLERLLRLFRREREQTTFVYCPTCHTELCSSQKAAYWEDQNLVNYSCSCGTISRWDFDAPVPLLIDYAFASNLEAR